MMNNNLRGLIKMRRAAVASACAGIIGVSLLVASCGKDTPGGPEEQPNPMHAVMRAVKHPGGDHASGTVSIDGHNAPDAVFTLNGVEVEMSSDDVFDLGVETAFFEFLNSGLEPGQVLTAKMTGNGMTVERTATIPASPVITAPALGGMVSKQSDLVISWTSPTNPQRFLVVYEVVNSSDPLFFAVVDGASRSVNVPAQRLQATGIGEREVNVTAINGGGAIDPVDYTREEGFYAKAEPEHVVVQFTVE